MGTQNITHNNHYVPRFYLKNWSQDGKTIYTYSLLVSDSRVPYWRKESIKNTAVWYDLYTRKIAQQEIDDFETWFDREFEAPAKAVFEKLLHTEPLTKSDEIILSRFVASQHLRTPARLNSILELERKELPWIMENVLQKINKEAANGNLRNASKSILETDSLFPLKVNLDSEKGVAKVESVVGKSTYLYAIRYLLTETVKRLYGYRWTVLHAADGVSFPTSDDPVICLNYRNQSDYDFKGGWGRKHGNIIMPISPKLLLFTQIGDKGSYDSLDKSFYWSSFFVKIIIEHAHRAVFADQPQKGMSAINPRVVNKELYDAESQIMRSWHSEQMLAEDELLNNSTQ